MKSVVEAREEVVRKLPYLAEMPNGIIVLVCKREGFTAAGTVVGYSPQTSELSRSNHPIGTYEDKWILNFRIFEGTVTLSNS